MKLLHGAGNQRRTTIAASGSSNAKRISRISRRITRLNRRTTTPRPPPCCGDREENKREKMRLIANQPANRPTAIED